MSLAWAVNLPAGEKLVLLALADCANDEGRCWPGLTSLARKTGKSRRSLIDTIQSLEKSGHISREILVGKGTNYTIHPVTDEQLDLPIAGAKSAPVQKPHQCKNAGLTGAKIAPKPSLRTVSKEDKSSSSFRVVNAWNKMAEANGLSIIRTLSNDRKQKLRLRLNEHGEDGLLEAIDAIPKSSFLRGDNDRGWRPGFDFILQPSSLTKLLEGFYSSATPRQQQGGEVPYFKRLAAAERA